MQSILVFFLQLCILMVDPAHSPRSPELLMVILACYCLVSFATLLFDGVGSAGICAAVIACGLLIEGGGIALLLAYKRVLDRFVPTFAALLAVGALMTTALLPVNLLAEAAGEDARSMAFFVGLLWWLVVAGFILQRAANISFMLGVFFAFTTQIIFQVSAAGLLEVP